MTRAVLFLCLTTFVLTHAAPEPSKRCCEQGPDCMNPCPEEPGAGLMAPAQPAPYMPAPEAPQMDCCQPGPECANPCPAPPPQEQNFYPSEPAQGQDQDQEAAPQPPPPEGNMFQDCCAPGPSCFNPCGMPPPPPPPPADFGMAGCCDPSVMPMCPNPCPPPQPPRPQVTAYAPYPGEITMKLKQPWKSELTDHASAAYQILSGNLATAIKAALRREAYVNNVYFREGYVPGNPSTQPITVAHFMVDGGSDDASVLQQSVTPDESMGDGLKVYKDSFNAY